MAKRSTPAPRAINHLSAPGAWPTTPMVLGGRPVNAPPVADSPPTPDIGNVGLDRPLPDTNLPVNLGTLAPAGQVAPPDAPAAVRAPAGIQQVPGAVQGAVPFTPPGPIAAPGGLVIVRRT